MIPGTLPNLLIKNIETMIDVEIRNVSDKILGKIARDHLFVKTKYAVVSAGSSPDAMLETMI
jgi:hypothetical protein